MSVQSAMSAAVSGIQNQSRALGSVSDNIANVNSIAYKRTDVRFLSQVTQSGGSNTSIVPGGTQAVFFSNIQDEGLPKPTQNPTDLAIGKRGFFVVKRTPENSAANASFYTRVGDFRIDREGFLKNSAGYYLQGWKLEDGETDFGAVVPINLASFASPAQQSTKIELDMNLPAEAKDGDKESIDVEIFDSLGVAHNINLQFTKKPIPAGSPPGTTGAWGVSIPKMTKVSDGTDSLSDPDPATAGVTLSFDTITFDSNGKPNLLDGSGDPLDPKIQINFTGVTTSTGGILGDGASNDIQLDLGTHGQPDGATYNAASFSIRKKFQDGIPYGVFEDVSIDDKGVVTASFTNGTKRDLYLIPLATFNDANSLQQARGGIFVQTTQSGSALLQSPGVGQASTITSKSLESSRVDIADEFTRMIEIQRAYSANARMITTSSEMLEEILRVV